MLSDDDAATACLHRLMAGAEEILTRTVPTVASTPEQLCAERGVLIQTDPIIVRVLAWADPDAPPRELARGGAGTLPGSTGTAMAWFLSHGFNTIATPEVRALAAETAKGGRVAFALMLQPDRGRASAWLLPKSGDLGNSVKLFELAAEVIAH